MGIHIASCPGDEKTSSHRLISSKPYEMAFFDLDRTMHYPCKGSPQAFLKRAINPRRIAEGDWPCWRRTQDHGKSYCSGRHVSMELVVSLPAILVFQIFPPHDSDVNHVWNFNKEIEIEGENEQGAEVKVHYDVVGRSYFGVRHFYGRVRSGRNCYDFNDLNTGGKMTSLIHDNPIDFLLAGKQTPSDGKKTTSVVYYLREGIQGMKAIQRRIWRRLREHSEITVHSPSGDVYPAVDSSREGEELVDGVMALQSHPSRRDVDDYQTLSTKALQQPEAAVEGTVAGLILHTGDNDETVMNDVDGAVTEVPTSKEGREIPRPFPPISTAYTMDRKHTEPATAVASPARDEVLSGRKPRTKLSQRASLTSSSQNTTVELCRFCCRCGFDGSLNDSQLDQNIISCDAISSAQTCVYWSHEACQPDGWTTYMKANERFMCRWCQWLNRETDYGYAQSNATLYDPT